MIVDALQDEILQISIIDVNGNVRFDSYFKPCVRSWDAAQAVNGIACIITSRIPL